MEETAELAEEKAPDSGELEEDLGSPETADAPPEGSDDSAENGSALSALKEGLSALQALTEEISHKLEHNQRREELINKLHDENQGYKSGLYQKLIMPLVKEIIFIMDGYAQLRDGYAKKDISEVDTAKLLKQFGEIVDDLEHVLSKNGIESYSAEEGTTVDPARQKILKTVPTDDPKKDKTICERLKKGFILEDKIIRQEQVTCYKFEE